MWEKSTTKNPLFGALGFLPCAKQKSQIKMEEDVRKGVSSFVGLTHWAAPLPLRGGGRVEVTLNDCFATTQLQ